MLGDIKMRDSTLLMAVMISKLVSGHCRSEKKKSLR